MTSCSRYTKWTPVTMTEMHVFLGNILNMGIVQLPELEDYWKTSWVCELPFVRCVFPRDRFELIFWMLYVSHTESGQPVKRIDKFQALLQLLIPRFQASYKQWQNMAINETMVGFRGRFARSNTCPRNSQNGRQSIYHGRQFQLLHDKHSIVHGGGDTG